MAREIATGITADPDVMVGKPVIAGTRMPVALVLAKLAANPDLDEFFLDYPELTVDDVKAALRYAATVAQEKSRCWSPRQQRMRFLLDQNVESRIGTFLNDHGHNATRIGLDYPVGVPDPDILAIAHRE